MYYLLIDILFRQSTLFRFFQYKNKAIREPTKLCILLRGFGTTRVPIVRTNTHWHQHTHTHPRTVSYEKSLEINGSHCRIFSKRRESQRATHAYRCIPTYRYLIVKIAHVGPSNRTIADQTSSNRRVFE